MTNSNNLCIVYLVFDTFETGITKQFPTSNDGKRIQKISKQTSVLHLRH